MTTEVTTKSVFFVSATGFGGGDVIDDVKYPTDKRASGRTF
jgi:hypothetical protein